MSFLEVLESSLGDPVVDQHWFLLRYNPANKKIYCFFEGKTDSSFYSPLISKRCPAEFQVEVFVCDGKQKVLDLYTSLTHIHANSKPFLFFIDKDHDDILGVALPNSPLVYITSAYSVENFIVSESLLQQLCRDLLGISEGSQAYKTILEQYQAAYSRFLEFALFYMSWVLLHREKGNKVNLNNVKTSKLCFVNQDLELVICLNDREVVEFLEKAALPVESEKIDLERINFKKRIISKEYLVQSIVRGHLVVDFFVSFFKSLQSVYKSVAKNKKINYKERTQLTEKNFIDILGPRASAPQCLSAFLDRFFQVVFPPQV